SQVYAEPKRLVALGLAVATGERTGRRSRTVYSITPAGRKALADWLRSPVAKGPLFEFEGLLRVFLAPFGSDADLALSLEQVRQEIVGLVSLSARIRGEYLAGRAPFQRFAPTRAMIHDFLTHFGVLVDEWSKRSLERLAASEGMSDEDRSVAAIATFSGNT